MHCLIDINVVMILFSVIDTKIFREQSIKQTIFFWLLKNFFEPENKNTTAFNIIKPKQIFRSRICVIICAVITFPIKIPMVEQCLIWNAN